MAIKKAKKEDKKKVSMEGINFAVDELAKKIGENATADIQRVFDSYPLEVEGVSADVNIIERKKGFVKEYFLNFPHYGAGTESLLKSLKNTLISETSISTETLFDPKLLASLKQKLSERANQLLEKEIFSSTEQERKTLIGLLLQEMLGIGKIEFLLADANLEEIVVNTSKEPSWVYHKKFGWLETNVSIPTEADIQNYGSIIARRVGKQITTLSPLLDAHLTSGDRVNATLFPISNKGNTLTIRRFRREPWTVTDLIETNTVNSELMALLWEAMEYELNVIFSGGTASGKTTILGICLPFIQANNRIISIEDTRELRAPDFMHWVPLTTREPNPEGKGGVSMLDLLVNSLRMRPDRIIVGEIRRKEEAEVMFEGMHTGHSVYTTVHANTADETIRRLTNPPINIPVSLLDAVHLNIVMFRNRRLGVRRVLQVAEFIHEKRTAGEESVKANILYRWRASDDKIVKANESIRLFDELSLHTGYSKEKVIEQLKEKQKVLDWMVKQKIHNVNSVGKVVSQYYKDRDSIMDLVKNDKPWTEE
jgi:flagellar protein FlaI